MKSHSRDFKPIKKSFLDTSVVCKLHVGTSLQQEHLSNAIPKDWYVDSYIKMEFYRACLMQWIYLYFESGESIHNTFGDAMKYYSQRFSREAKATVNAIGSLEFHGFSMTRPEHKEGCRQRLLDFIFEIAIQFRETFKDTGNNPTRCARVPSLIKLPERASERDGILQAVRSTFDNVKECRSKCQIENLFDRESYKTKLDAVSKTTKKTEPLEKIREAITTAQADPSRITCRLCAKMGDAIIASILDPAWKLHSLDSAHETISEAIGLEYQIHPSDAALRNMTKTTAADSPAGGIA